eukprot:7364041-Prymnesium_polylepis.1
MILGSLDASHMCSDRLVIVVLTRFYLPKTTKPPLTKGDVRRSSAIILGGPPCSITTQDIVTRRAIGKTELD